MAAAALCCGPGSAGQEACHGRVLPHNLWDFPAQGLCEVSTQSDKWLLRPPAGCIKPRPYLGPRQGRLRQVNGTSQQQASGDWGGFKPALQKATLTRNMSYFGSTEGVVAVVSVR